MDRKLARQLGLTEEGLRDTRRRELADMLRMFVQNGAAEITLTMDAQTALQLAEDLEAGVGRDVEGD